MPWALFLLATLAAGLYPLRARLHCWPMTMDGTLWVSRSALFNADWWRWDLLTHHFIGYRPMAALSLSLDNLMGGLDPLPYRLTDAGLHGLTALLIYSLARALLEHRGAAALPAPSARWGAWLAMLVFLGHPAMEEAVPLLARRSYTLTAAFGAAAVLVFLRACRRPGWRSWPALGSALLLMGAILSNEEGYVVVPLLSMLALHLRPPASGTWRQRVSPALLPWLATVLALVVKLAATQELGGYSHSFPKPKRFLGIGRKAVDYLFFPPSGTDQPTVILASRVGLALVLACLVWCGLLKPGWFWLRARQRGTATDPWQVPLILLVWLSGYVLLSLLTGAWYLRQAYPALVPLSLLMGAIFHLGVVSQGRHPIRMGLHLLPLGVLLFAILYHSPILHGLSENRVHSAHVQQARLETAYHDLQALPEPALVYLASPTGTSQRKTGVGVAHLWYQGQRTSSWLSILLRDKKIRIRDIAFLTPRSGHSDDIHCWYDTVEERPVLRVAPHTTIGLPRGRFKATVHRDPAHGQFLWLDELPTHKNKQHFLYYFDGMQGTLVPLDVDGWKKPAASPTEQQTSARKERAPPPPGDP